MEITLKPINLSDVGVITAILAFFYFALRQYLSSSISEKIKYEFSKELKALETNLNRTSTISIQHRELERNAIIEFHTMCTVQLSKILIAPKKYTRDRIEKYLELLEDIETFKISGTTSASNIHFIVVDNTLRDETNKLLRFMIDLTLEYQEKLTEILSELQKIISNDYDAYKHGYADMALIDKKIDEFSAFLDKYPEESYSYLNEYRETAKKYLLT